MNISSSITLKCLVSEPGTAIFAMITNLEGKFWCLDHCCIHKVLNIHLCAVAIATTSCPALSAFLALTKTASLTSPDILNIRGCFDMAPLYFSCKPYILLQRKERPNPVPLSSEYLTSQRCGRTRHWGSWSGWRNTPG